MQFLQAVGSQNEASWTKSLWLKNCQMQGGLRILAGDHEANTSLLKFYRKH